MSGNLSLVQWANKNFWPKVDTSGDCWEWTAALRPDGYGVIGRWIDRKTVVLRAHRVSWELHNGPIPDGLTVDHVCFNRKRVRPAHLQLLTLADNSAKTQRAVSSTCKRGHRYDEDDNLYLHPTKGARECRACRRLAVLRFEERHQRLGSEVLHCV